MMQEFFRLFPQHGIPQLSELVFIWMEDVLCLKEAEPFDPAFPNLLKKALLALFVDEICL
jgi:hypothetical protein